jgi:hypothetical protein
MGIGGLRFDSGGDTRCGSARSTGNSWKSWVSSGGVVRVEPEHVDGVIIPKRHDEDHSTGEGTTHGTNTTENFEFVSITSNVFLVITEGIGDRVILEVGVGREVGLRVRDDLSTLDVEPLDLGESTSVGTISGNELGHNGEDLGGIDSHSWAIEGLVTHTVGVEVTTIFITRGGVTAGRRVVTTLGTGTFVQSSVGAHMGSIGSRDTVGFPDIHLVTAHTEVTSSRVWIVSVTNPASDVGSTIDPLQVLRALRITVSSSVSSSCLVGRESSHTTICGHLREVEGTIETTWQIGDINIEGELLIQKLKQVIFGAGVQKVDTGTNVGLGALGDEIDLERVARGGNTVG